MFQNRLATLTSVLDDNRSDLDAALTESVRRDRRGAALRRGQPEPDRRADPAAWATSPRSWSTTGWRSRTSCTSRRTRSPTSTTSTTRHGGSVDRRVLARQLLEPGAGRLRHDRRRREHHRARDGEAVRAVPRSGAAAAQLQRPARSRSTRTCGRDQPGPDHLHRSEAGAGRRRDRATRRSRRRRCRPTPARATSRRRPGWNGPPNTTGAVCASPATMRRRSRRPR